MLKIPFPVMKRLFLFSLIVFASISFFSCSSEPDIPGENNPQQMEEEEMESLRDAPDFSLKTIMDTDLSLTQFQDKVLVIFFFGHNCPPCLSVAPKIETDLNQEFKNKSDFALIGIDVWDGSIAEVETYINTTESTYQIGLNGSSVGSDYKSGRDRLVVINKEGKVAFSGSQVAKNDLNDVKDILNTLLD